MEVYIFMHFSIIIIYLTVHALLKLFSIAYNRRELTKRKYRWMVTITLLTGTIVASIFPFTIKTLFT
ncbi:hypothetical protein [Rossellomorea arthrocnemi]|uniref:hypothetical protein n=1 Tax=Rossellomorea arthrocnemi TaxID=2769542 RepID=UPI00191B8D13|nr:hypothetical protein [Rossellomorea arthrocnemi]